MQTNFVLPDRLTQNSLLTDQIATLRERGFGSFENIASLEEIAELKGICERLIFAGAGAQEGALFDFIGDNPLASTALTQLSMPSNFNPRLRRTNYHKRLEVLARQVLGPKARFAGDHLFYKPPVAGPETPWHQDEAFHDPRFNYQEVSFWLPLQPATIENGCLRFIPGSHRWSVQPHRKLPGKERSHGIECYEGFDPDDAIFCPVPVGGCTVHLGRTLHGAGPNVTATARFAYVVVFDVPATVSTEYREFNWLNQTTTRDEIEVNWLRGKGKITALYRRVMRRNNIDPYRLYYGFKRRWWTLMHKRKRI
ncbi:phytanoyl-CoA dioxygenase family protein [Paraburkholderia sp. Ac-20336]|uniref:phytanoyl-CoA dioxygenase family protein n=1 Tax=unclassified Paraburkholderia TaxID=2615204 RepID=UPI00198033DE|nr:MULTISPECIES: phytanoyl-CoA dioxygenase family protein [unclassified Paraburkholderia]MBN3804183.1 phytanoyl-CoA dioxygenase family protein [Paraburkholderia sp. Ac-20336]MBN3845305.1 phytanoyl-CoA dioxygenase family protein [Paraburkholderia sp. Ac-20342]